MTHNANMTDSEDDVMADQNRAFRHPWLLSYGIAVFSVALALGTTLAASPWLNQTPGQLFLVAVMLSAWYGGLGPGSVATILSVLAVNYFFYPPNYAFDFSNFRSVVQLSVFMIAAFLISGLNEARRLALRKAEINLSALQESETRFSRLAETNILGIIVANMNGAIVEANDAFLRMVGYTRAEMLSGQVRWRDMTPPDYLEVSQRSIQELHSLGFCNPFEKEYIRKDGSRVPVLIGSAMTSTHTVLGFVLDLSERKQAERAKQQAYEQLAEKTHQLEQSNEELQLMMIELEAVQDEISQQNEELIFARETAETERQRYQDLFNFAPDGYIVTNARGLIQEANQAIADLIGIDASFLINTPLAIYILSSERRAFRDLLYELHQHPQQQKQQTDAFSLQPARDQPIPVELTATTICDAQGRLSGIRWLMQDITERKQAEIAVRESEERLRLALRAANQGLYDLNVQTGEAIVSPEYAQMLGYKPDEFQETNARWRDRLHPDDVAAVYQVYEDYIAGRLDEYRVEFRQQTRSGEWKWILSVGKIVCWTSDDRPLRMLGTHTDITDRKQAEVEREQFLRREQAARQQAESANRIKDEFLAVLSHELRSPLNPILGWSKLLQTGRLDDDATKQALVVIERNAKLQSELIEDLLDISRILRGKLRLNHQLVDVAAIVQAAMETVRLAAEAKSIDLYFTILHSIGNDGELSASTSILQEQDEPLFHEGPDKLYVMGDSTRLQQVVWNLLSNAIKFTPAGGRVDVQLQQVSDPVVQELQSITTSPPPHPSPSPPAYSAQIVVRDTGKGISPDFLPYVFDHFRQADSATTRKFGGLGLGLAIVRHLVELHGGSVQADSPGEGLGATFIVRLPLLKAGGEREKPEESGLSSDQECPLAGLRILVVDDDADARDLVSFLLEQAGASVIAISSAENALTALSQSQLDILLSDIGMPNTDGYMLMRQIRALAPEQGGCIPAIALTAYTGDFNQQQAMQAGFQRHLAKPIDPKSLINAIVHLVQPKSKIKGN